MDKRFLSEGGRLISDISNDGLFADQRFIVKGRY